MKNLPVDHLQKATANDALARAIAQALWPEGDLEHEWDADTTTEIDAALRLWRPDLVPPPRPPIDRYRWSLDLEFDPEAYYRLCHENGWTPSQEGFKDWVMETLPDRIEARMSGRTYDKLKSELIQIEEAPFTARSTPPPDATQANDPPGFHGYQFSYIQNFHPKEYIEYCASVYRKPSQEGFREFVLREVRELGDQALLQCLRPIPLSGFMP
jgi:hypothetical protein